MNTFRKSLVKVVALPLLSILCSPVYAAPCNTLVSKTIKAPDFMTAQNNVPIVYVTLNQARPNGTLAQCKVSFNTPLAAPWWTLGEKCGALVGAITSGVDVNSQNELCKISGFKVTNDSCAFPFLNSFQLTGTGATTAVSLAISNDNFDLNDDNKGQSLKNYEEEVITPGCLAAAGGPGTEPKVLLAMKGTATGTSFVGGQSAAVEVNVDKTNNGGVVTTARVNTTAGMTAASIVSGLNTQLAQAGVTCDLVPPTSLFPFPAIVCPQPSAGFANGFGISTSDTGIGVGNASAPANTIMSAFNGPVTNNGDIPLPLPALVVLASLLAGSGIVAGRRKRKA